ncbi:protein of unknown function [Modestobacter italicus]|uniref:Uncharacterized protein n=1 Tax=Modestobacter italicus (strain DSM 44449 / CECT 9708 / BC 501) TaxID=2732864 RepID=I4F4W5_MODI5|nr:protein of unknown function [Modestobacter marinus]
MATPGWFNKRPGGAYALTASDAYWWHSACPCERSSPGHWRQISGRGDEGAWAAAWLDWLWRTHLQPRGFQRAGAPADRVLDLSLSKPADLDRLRQAMTAGPASENEPAPPPPFSSAL